MHELEIIYKKRKQQILPLVFGFAAFFVLFRVILPQWSDIQEVQQLLVSKSDSVSAKEASVTLLNSLSQETVDGNYNLVTTALPIQKDIVLIFTELSEAADTTGVILGGFSVKVGGVYSATKTVSPAEKSISGVPFLNIVISITGQPDNLKQFAKTLYNSIPLVEIKSIDIGKKDARYDVNFYYKPIALRPAGSDSTPLTGLSAQENAQIQQLKSWKNPSVAPSQ